MITLRKAEERGAASFGWLESQHSFSFGQYYDPRHMGFGALRVINDDRVAPGGGFSEHGHKDMEIISYVLEGALAHKDSIGNGSVLKAGSLQRMTAGKGIRHSEYNASRDDPLHFLQIWIVPERAGLDPTYEEVHPANQPGLILVGSRDGRDGSMTIHRDVDLYRGTLERGGSVLHRLDSDRIAWIQVVHGTIEIDGESLAEGDGAAIRDQDGIIISTGNASEFLLFDMAA